MEDCPLNIASFQQWATGNLVENRNRGIFAEWLVGQKLQALDGEEFREEWKPWDLKYRDKRIEVKAVSDQRESRSAIIGIRVA